MYQNNLALGVSAKQTPLFGNFSQKGGVNPIPKTFVKLDLVQPCVTQKISMNNPLFKTRPRNPWHVGPLKVTLFKGKEYYPIPMDP